MPDPSIEQPRDAIVRVTLSAICGSDLHMYDNYIPTIKDGDIDPSFVITHRLPLDEAPDGYKKFWDKEDGCVKVVLKP